MFYQLAVNTLCVCVCVSYTCLSRSALHPAVTLSPHSSVFSDSAVRPNTSCSTVCVAAIESALQYVSPAPKTLADPDTRSFMSPSHLSRPRLISAHPSSSPLTLNHPLGHRQFLLHHSSPSRVPPLSSQPRAHVRFSESQ